MGICRFCKEDAGLLCSAHRMCADQSQKAIQEIYDRIRIGIVDVTNNTDIQSTIRQLCIKGFVGPDKANELVTSAWEKGVDAALDDGILTAGEELRIYEIASILNINTQYFLSPPVSKKAVLARVLNEVTEGRVPTRPFQTSTSLPFIFQKGEQVVWAFSQTTYIAEEIYLKHVSETSGKSTRYSEPQHQYFNSKHVESHVEQRKGVIVEERGMAEKDHGWFAVTNKHLYFAGSRESARIPFNEIISVQPHKDGIGVTREGANNKIQIFQTGNGRFTHTLVINLVRIAAME